MRICPICMRDFSSLSMRTGTPLSRELGQMRSREGKPWMKDVDALLDRGGKQREKRAAGEAESVEEPSARWTTMDKIG